jgi:hypothetical protein
MILSINRKSKCCQMQMPNARGSKPKVHVTLSKAFMDDVVPPVSLFYCGSETPKKSSDAGTI